LNGQTVDFIGPAGVIADGIHVYAHAIANDEAYLFAFDRATGDLAWQSPIDDPNLSSWSTPALDDSRGLVVIASDNHFQGYDTSTGDSLWSITLDTIVVNASPLIVTDLGRAYITTFQPFGVSQLVCVDVDAGATIWQVPIGPSSGSTPAFEDGIVYVATSGPPGLVMAFDAAADDPPDPIWMTDNPEEHGFFGGPAIADGSLFVASYNFNGGQLNSNLLKLDATTGDVLWSTPSGRTDSTPIPTGDRVILSTGLFGFGAVPSVQLFTDLGDGAQLDWDSALDSWVDANNNGVINPGEFLDIGNWNHQPIVIGDTLLVGSRTPGGNEYDANGDLRLIDLTRTPDDPDFVIDHNATCGSTPALAGGDVYSVGVTGLHAFLATCEADCNADGSLNILDFVCFQGIFTAGDPGADCNADGALNILDFVCYQQAFQSGCP
jgi:outer membrane protein assembly factor BamB